MEPSGAVSKAAPAFAKVIPAHGPPAPGGGLLFPLNDAMVKAAMPLAPSAPPAPAFFGPLGGSLSKLPGGGSFAPMPDMAPPGPPGLPFGIDGVDPPGPPPGLPPGFPPLGMPFMEAMPPPGFPPGMGPPATSSEHLPEGAPKDASFGPDVVPKAPPGSPPREEKPEIKKRKKGVEGLASNKAIKNGGAVTIYSGYDALTVEPKVAETSEKPPASAQTQITGQSVIQGLQRQLPAGWEMRKSRSTGKVYYVNEKLGKSQFEPPAGSTVDKQVDKKKKASTKSKDVPDAQFTDRGGMLGLMRANEQKKGRWAKWQKCNEILNEPDPEDEAKGQDDASRWKGKGRGKGKRRDDDDDD